MYFGGSFGSAVVKVLSVYLVGRLAWQYNSKLAN